MKFEAISDAIGRATRTLGLLATTCLVSVPLTATDVRAELSPIGSLTGFRQTVAEAAASDDDLAAFYRARDFAGAWTGADDAAVARRNALLSAMSAAPLHGLPAQAFDAEALIARLRAATTPLAQAEMDVEMSRMFLAYAHAINTGYLAPGDTVPLIVREVQVRPGLALLDGFMAATSPEGFLRDLVPASPEYTRLLRLKLDLEALMATGGWGPSVGAASLLPGAAGDDVVALRNRLIAMGYIGRSVTRTYDAAIMTAVQAFQTAHGMEADGIAGAETIRQINVPVEERLERVIVALERERWMNNLDRGDRYIWVNLTDFTAKIMDDDAETFSTRSVIGAGALDRQTPEFSNLMSHMVINPAWYVPRSIMMNDYGGTVPRGFQAINSQGRVANVSNVGNGTYSLRQPPGPGNALGEVKFMFPNPQNIYLHDTPSQSLFANAVRAFSHGCIRLDDPRDFAYALLARQTDDPQGLYESYRRSGEEVRVNLDIEVPVHIVYRTAFTDVEGRLQFRNDIYGRDEAIWQALSAAGVEIGALRG